MGKGEWCHIFSEQLQTWTKFSKSFASLNKNGKIHHLTHLKKKLWKSYKPYTMFTNSKINFALVLSENK